MILYMAMFLQSWHRNYIPQRERQFCISFDEFNINGQEKTLGDVMLGDLKRKSQKIVEDTAAA